MQNRNNRRRTYKDSFWSYDPSDDIGFYPVNIVTAPLIDSYMQAAALYGGSMFDTGFGNRKTFTTKRGFQGGSRIRNSSFGRNNRRFSPKVDRRRSSYRSDRGKRSSNDLDDRRDKRKRAKTSAEKEGGDKKEASGSGNKSSKLGTNAASEDRKRSERKRNDRRCTVCESEFTGSYTAHRRSKEHRDNREKKFPQCRFCHKKFQSTKEYDTHAATDDHKKKVEEHEALEKRRALRAAMSDSEDDTVSIKRYIAKQGEETVPDEAAKPTGISKVVLLEINFCKLCQKPLSSSIDALRAHCKTTKHNKTFKAYREGKETRAAERIKEKALQEKASQEEGEGQEEGNEEEDEDQEEGGQEDEGQEDGGQEDEGQEDDGQEGEGREDDGQEGEGREDDGQEGEGQEGDGPEDDIQEEDS